MSNKNYEKSPAANGEMILLYLNKKLSATNKNSTWVKTSAGDVTADTYFATAQKKPAGTIMRIQSNKSMIYLPVKNSNFKAMFKKVFPGSHGGTYTGNWYGYGYISAPGVKSFEVLRTDNYDGTGTTKYVKLNIDGIYFRTQKTM